MQSAVGAFGVQIHAVNAATERDFDAAFARVKELRAGGLVISNSAPFNGRSAERKEIKKAKRASCHPLI